MRKFLIILFLFLFTLPTTSRTFTPVVPSYPFSFPKDHASHPDFKTEWWYFTGHFQSEEGKTYGFQWTIFRTALNEKDLEKKCLWCGNQVYLGHTALSDLNENKFYYDQGISRELEPLTSASQKKFEVKLPRYSGKSNDQNWTIQNSNAQFSYELELKMPDQVLLHGDKGYAPKSKEIGKASYYYSVPHIPLQGVLDFQGKKMKVQGRAWMDHEFASSALSENQKGWDWFGLPLTSKSSLMLYRLRDKLDSKQDFIFATYVNEQGQQFTLSREDINLTALKIWKSKKSKSIYPIQWKIEIPKHFLNIQVSAHIENQELDTQESTRVTYWEGSVGVQGFSGDAKIESKGYLEMTGYDLGGGILLSF